MVSKTAKRALMTKQHHSVADGIGALRMAEVYTDLERDAPAPPEVDVEGDLRRGGRRRAGRVARSRCRHGHQHRRHRGAPRSGTTCVARAASPTRLAGRAVNLVTPPERTRQRRGHVVGEVRSAARHRRRWPQRRRARAVVDRALAASSPRSAARRTSKTPRRRPRRSAVRSTTSSSPAPPSARSAYHAERDAEVEAINMTFVVSTRTDKVDGRQLVHARAVAGAGRAMRRSAERFAQVRDLMADRKDGVSGRGAMSAIAGIANLLPTSVTTRVARDQAAKIDFATSNLRGAPIPDLHGRRQGARAVPARSGCRHRRQPHHDQRATAGCTWASSSTPRPSPIPTVCAATSKRPSPRSSKPAASSATKAPQTPNWARQIPFSGI